MFRTCQLYSNADIQINRWYFITAVLDGSTGKIFINVKQTAQLKQCPTPNYVVRNLNFIGKSNGPNDDLSNAIYDDVKIFNKALDPIELTNEFYTENYLGENSKNSFFFNLAITNIKCLILIFR